MKLSLILSLLFLFACTSNQLIFEGQNFKAFHEILITNDAEDITRSTGVLIESPDSQTKIKFYQLKNKKIILTGYNKETLIVGKYISISKTPTESAKFADFEHITFEELNKEIKKSEP